MSKNIEYELTRDELVDIRLNAGLTQQQMADLLGVSRSSYSQRECGSLPISVKFAVSVRRKMAEEGFANICKPLFDNDNALQEGQYVAQNANVHGDAVNVIGNAHSNVNIGTQQSDQPAEVAVVPAEVLTEQLEVVQNNQEMLQAIQEQQARDHRLKKEQGEQLNNILEFVQGLDTVMQTRVREVIDERTRTIINTANHHIHSQALVMLTAIEGIISMVEADCGSKEVFLKQLNNVRAQLEKMASYEAK